MGIICVMSVLIVGMIVCIISLVKRFIKKQQKRAVIISMIINSILFLAIALYAASHATYYKYNDWSMMQSNINMVEKKYGDFDLGKVEDNKKGRVAYYIYTDNGPIMPDHLKHYYYMEYDEWGVIYHVYDGVQPGA